MSETTCFLSLRIILFKYRAEPMDTPLSSGKGGMNTVLKFVFLSIFPFNKQLYALPPEKTKSV